MKKFILLLLVIGSMFVAVSAGTIKINPWTVYWGNQVGETHVLYTTTTSKKSITVQLSRNGSVRDKVKFWTSEFYSEAFRCPGVVVQEGSSGTSYNYNNTSNEPGEEIRIQYRNANSGFNTDYEIYGSANYY